MSTTKHKKYVFGTMSCSPMVDGISSKVTCKCDEGCKFWNECLKEIGKQYLRFKFVERPSTEYEIKRGWFHLFGKQNKKVSWELIHK